MTEMRLKQLFTMDTASKPMGMHTVLNKRGFTPMSHYNHILMLYYKNILRIIIRK